MTTILSNRRPRLAMRCVQCGDELLAPEWSEPRNERQIHYVWSCWKCDYCFETVVTIKPSEGIKTGEDIFASRLVA
jgi:hypothetical protein